VVRALSALSILAVSLTLAVAGCGGEGGDAGTDAASFAPQSAAFFVTFATEGEEWESAEELYRRFPAAERARREVLEDLAEEDLDWDRDVRPALGPELALVGFGEGEGEVVALTQPADREALDRLVAKSDGELTYEMVEDWAVLGETAADVGAFREALGDESLADTDEWNDATDDLPEDALVVGYVNGDSVNRSFGDRVGGIGGGNGLPIGGRFPSIGFAVGAQDDGVRLDAEIEGAETDLPDAYEAALPDELPAGALAYVSWHDAAASIRETLRQAGDTNPEVDRTVAQLELALGLSLERDVLPLFAGEGALALYPGAVGSATPDVALVLEVEDEERALAILDGIVERAAGFGVVTAAPDVAVGDVEARVVAVEGMEILYAAWDGKLLATTSEAALAAIEAGGETLADDPSFLSARDSSAAPSETVGFAYVNIGAIVDEFGSGEEEAENFEPLGPLFLYGTRDDDGLAVGGFLAVE
jgi:hypothetical protein